MRHVIREALGRDIFDDEVPMAEAVYDEAPPTHASEADPPCENLNAVVMKDADVVLAKRSKKGSRRVDIEVPRHEPAWKKNSRLELKKP